MPTVAQVSGLFLYPVKSLGGIAVPAAELDALGLVGDRRFLVVDPAGRFLTQRTLPRMALIGTALTADCLVLRHADAAPLSVSLAPDSGATLLRVSVWGSEGLAAEDCGEAPARWLEARLGVACRLVRIGPAFHRPILKSGSARPGDAVTFADAYPLLALGEASLADLNDRLVAAGEEPVPMDRFRPNLVLSGCPAYAEDTWPTFRIGSALFRAGGPCARCIMTTTDQQTGARGPEPLRTLARYRRDAAKPSDVNFGQNVIHETKTGRIRVGDTVSVP